MILNAAIVLVTVLAGGLMLWPRLAGNRLWRASITPLASIIGSGFLVLGPILQSSYGAYAPLVMAALCGVAYLFGNAIRFNIQRLARPYFRPSKSDTALETLASWSLTFAYIISVAYYLNLLGSFSVSLTSINDAYHAKLVTTGTFAIILLVGWAQGFEALERMEQVFVGIKLAIIAGLIFGLAWFFGEHVVGGTLVAERSTTRGWEAITLAFGLLVTVQGFETSRYLSDDYDAQTRVRSMRLAQWVSSAIYMIYIAFLTYTIMPAGFDLSETAIIDLMQVVAPILPLLLIAAALSAQFSAGVADTSGAGGLLAELSHQKVSARAGYAVLVVVGVILTWTLSVFDIIGYASRAFALYYGLQAVIAANGAREDGESRGRIVLYSVFALLGFAIAIFGTPVE